MAENNQLTAALAAYGAALRYEMLPPEVVEQAKLLVMDTIGAGLWGSNLAWGRLVMQMISDFGSAPCASVWGTPLRCSPADAALVNGTFCHGFELDDIHRNALLHAGAVTVVPALAVCHRQFAGRTVTGSEFIAAVVAGCEIGARVGLISGLAQLKQGFHASARTGVFSAAAAAASILRLPADRFIHALGIAGSMAAGLMAAQHGAMVKRMHLGRAAQSGVYAGILAQRGFTGIEDVFDAPYGGFLSVVKVDADATAVTESLSSRYEILNIGFKPYSSCAGTHTSIDAVLDLLKAHPEIQPDSIDKIEIDMATVNKEHVGWLYEPKSITTAQMNVGYCVAVALRCGQVFVDSFTPEAIGRQDLVELARRVVVRSSAEYDRMGLDGRYAVRVQITLVNGKRFAREKKYPRGSNMEPLSREEIMLKFKHTAGKVVSETKADLIREMIRHLEGIDDVAELEQLLQYE